MTQRSKVSIIIPVYGVEKYIERCIRSLFEQTLREIEYIFIDDCTPDKSIEILKSVIEDYPHRKGQVVIHRMEKNSGQAAVRRWGALNATGEYVIHCDSDDWVDTKMYEDMYNRAVEDGADVVVCDYNVTDGTTNFNTTHACHADNPKQLVENCLFQRDPWSLCNKLVKRQAYYKVVFPDGAMGEDMVMTIQLLWNCETLSYIKWAYYQYFFNPESITKVCTKDSCIRKFNQLLCNSDIVLGLIEKKHLEDYYEESLVVYKNFIRSILYPIVYEKQYHKKWNSMFKGLNRQVIFSKHISLSEKCRVILTMFHLYPRKKDRAY